MLHKIRFEATVNSALHVYAAYTELWTRLCLIQIAVVKVGKNGTVFGLLHFQDVMSFAFILDYLARMTNMSAIICCIDFMLWVKQAKPPIST
jgi:hypothetical protein